MTLALNGKVAVVTAAAQGIGAASARIMAARGATVILGDMNGAGVKDVAASINAAGGKASAVLLDVRDEGSVRNLIEGAHEAHGRLDILHNNAGGTIPGPRSDGCRYAAGRVGRNFLPGTWTAHTGAASTPFPL